ncbi:MAG TPA: SusC/RagA family TonB-linked outer membrane protein [Chitinophagaceae bacterium]|nr:SusC/RagA family TonB-linked outer membrane protein [Chitinophagaceae bacterium]
MKTFTIAEGKLLTRSLLIWSLLVILITTSVSAQQKTVTGTVKSSEDESPVMAATIQIKGTNIGTTTDQKGNFSINVSDNQILVVSAVGFATLESRVGNKTVVNFNLVSSSTMLEGVVVTALGIKRAEKALGYSAQQINGEELTEARSNNWSSALSGKVAGLQLISAGSGPVNSTRITLRGDISLNPNNNNALIVIDGVPMNNRNMTGSGVEQAYQAGSGNDVPVDFGNNINDINPDDIESITVLKGPGATALYGSRAGNGAILITTKSGTRKETGIGVTVNSNISFNNVLRWPDYQYEYGQGTGKALNAAGEKYYSYGATADGASTSGTSSAYGPRFNGQMYYQYDPVTQARGAERTLWRPYKDNIKGFWRTGSTITNSVSLDGGNDKGTARLSVTHSKNKWIMPNTGFERITAQTGLNYKISDKLKINTKISYTNKKSDNLPATGYNNQSIAYFMIFQNPNVDLNWYKDRWKIGLDQIDQVHPFSGFIDNPYLIAYEMTNAINSNNVVGTISATYDISKKFDIMFRSGMNMQDEDRKQRRPFSTANFLRGYYKEQAITDFEVNNDFLFSYRDKIANDFTINASVGANKMVHRYNRVDSYIDGLVIPGVYKLNNGLASAQVKLADRNYNVNSVYGLAAFGYKNKYFIDVTARNDWSSTLVPADKSSFFYPSVNTSFILSDIFRLPSLISFAKLRLSAASAGNDTDPYLTKKYYGASEFPSSGSIDPILFNANLTPEISNNYEGGLDMRFLKNRLGFDVTVYNNTTRNQIVKVPLDPTTGYSSAILNSGKIRNRGVEVIINSKNISNKNFTWNTTVNWAKNDNEVLELAKEFESAGKQDIGYGGNATLQARVGGTTGDIYGFGFVRSPDGQIVYTSAGLPARPTDIQYIGNAFADWKGGIQNEFSYKNIRFSFLIDGQYGGMIYSQSHHKMTEQGKLKHTLRGREEDYIIGEGVVDDGTGRYTPNTKKVVPVDYFFDYYRRANVEANTFDASFIKLREVRLEYSLPKSVLGKSFIRQATLGLYGRDLLLITDFPVFDPETAALNGSTLLPGVEMGQLPSTRTMGVNLTLKF